MENDNFLFAISYPMVKEILLFPGSNNVIAV